MAACISATAITVPARLSSRRIANKARGFGGARVTCGAKRGMKVFAKVVKIEHEGKTYEVECDGHESILDAAIDAGIENLSYDCKMVKKGSVEQPGAMLSEDVEEAGYALLCVAVPTSDDVEISTITEDELLEVQLVA